MIVDTPANKAVVQRFWHERPDESHLTGITAFTDLSSLSPEGLDLDSIELHHGPPSAIPAHCHRSFWDADYGCCQKRPVGIWLYQVPRDADGIHGY